MSDDNPANAVNEKTAVKTWRAWRTVHEMVQDRVRRQPFIHLIFTIPVKFCYSFTREQLEWNRTEYHEKIMISSREDVARHTNVLTGL